MNQRWNVRRSNYCVCCGKFKDQELLLCWPCHRDQKRRYDGGYSQSVERELDQFEAAGGKPSVYLGGRP